MNKQTPPTTIVFDLGGVLIDWNPRYLYRKIFRDEEKVTWFLDTICTRSWHEQQDAGESTQDGTDNLIARHPSHASEIRAFYDRFDEMMAGPIAGSVDILRSLRRQGIPVYALSNWPAETFPDPTPPYEFLSWFDGLVVSGQEKVMKPEPEIFKILCSRYALEAETCLFVDDVAHNIAAAADLGFQVHHFTSPCTLRESLVNLGFLHET